MPVTPIVLSLLASLQGPVPTRPAPSPGDTVNNGPHALARADVEAWLDGFLPFALARGDVAGAVVVVVKDGQVLLQKGYGFADVAKRTAVDPERTLFRPGSVSKLVTWTAVMQLVEQGKLDLDRDVNGYLDFSIPPREGRPVTLRNLMTHTPGFEEVVKNLMVKDSATLPSLGAYLKAWTPNRIFAPGAVPAYSNYGVALAGYLVERVSGEPLDQYFERHVFGPLGMTQATFRQPLPASFAPDMSQGYQLGSGKPGAYELVGPAPAGALAASGAAMARFMIAHLQDGSYGSARILSAETARLMHGVALPVVPPLNSMLLGFYQKNIGGLRIIGHDGDTQFFHSSLNLFPDDGVGLYLSVNSTGKAGAAGPIRSALLTEFTERYFPVTLDSARVDSATAAQHARLFTGRYGSSRRSESSFLSLLNLAGQITVVPDTDGTLIVAGLQGLNGQPKHWREVQPFVWREVGGTERLAAKIENGRIVMFSVDEISPFMMFLPVPWYASSTWLLPVLGIGLGALLLTLLAWPFAAIVRRRNRVAFPLQGRDAAAYRLIRFAGLVLLVTLGGWLWTGARLSSDLFMLTPRLDPWLRALHWASLIVFVLVAIIALWNIWVVWKRPRAWLSKLWSLLLAAGCLGVLWIGVVFKLIGFGVHY
jgi:CubicO group peptidase (beta-lactamase class C family)